MARVVPLLLHRPELLNDFLYNEVLEIDGIDGDAENHVTTWTIQNDAAPFCFLGFYYVDSLNQNLGDRGLTLGAFAVS
jgi:hypothetical protein